MGEIPHESFLPTLIRLLNDRVAIQRAALASLPKVAGLDPSRADDGSPTTTTERVQRWKQWYQRRASLPRGLGGRGQTSHVVDQRDVGSAQRVYQPQR